MEPFAWLKDVFTRMPFHRNGDAFQQAKAGEPIISVELDSLLPDRWLKEHTGHEWKIDQIRREERRQKEKSRRLRRNSRK